MAGIVQDKITLITGAGSGIGRATAEIFAREGATVVIADVDESGGQETLDMVRKSGGQGMFVRADVSQASDVEAMVAAVVEQYGRLDCAFNNAGIAGEVKRTDEFEEAAWDRVIAINLTGVWLCMKYELKQMVKQGGGSIVNASSIAGIAGWELLTPYVAAKHGVSGMTKNAAIEYAKDGIRVNATCPGSILTPLVEGFMADQPDTMTEASLGSMYPMGRVGRSPEVGEAVAWLCSDKASFVTGILVPIDGGYVAR